MRMHCKACQAANHWTKDCPYGLSPSELFYSYQLTPAEVGLLLLRQSLFRTTLETGKGYAALIELTLNIEEQVGNRLSLADKRASKAAHKALAHHK